MNIPFISDLGDFTVIPNFQGEWEFKNAYVAGSLVSYKGKLYEARTLVDQSQDAVVIGHDDFQRADTVDGWGTASDSTQWVLAFEANTGDFRISGNKGVMDYTDSYDAGSIEFHATSLASNNTEVVIRFYYTGDPSFEYTIEPRRDEFGNITANYRVLNGGGSNDFVMEHNNSTLGTSFIMTSKNGLSPFPMVAATDYLIRVQTSGFQYRIKVWKASESEPIDWSFQLADSYIEMTDSFFLLSYAVATTPTTIYTKEMTIYSLPDAPDVNTTDWLLIG